MESSSSSFGHSSLGYLDLEDGDSSVEVIVEGDRASSLFRASAHVFRILRLADKASLIDFFRTTGRSTLRVRMAALPLGVVADLITEAAGSDANPGPESRIIRVNQCFGAVPNSEALLREGIKSGLIAVLMEVHGSELVQVTRETLAQIQERGLFFDLGVQPHFVCTFGSGILPKSRPKVTVRSVARVSLTTRGADSEEELTNVLLALGEDQLQHDLLVREALIDVLGQLEQAVKVVGTTREPMFRVETLVVSIAHIPQLDTRFAFSLGHFEDKQRRLTKFDLRIGDQCIRTPNSDLYCRAAIASGIAQAIWRLHGEAISLGTRAELDSLIRLLGQRVPWDSAASEDAG